VDKVQAEGDVRVGVNVIKRALEEPFRQIVFNAGLEGSVLLNEVRKAGGTMGFDARNEKMVDLLESGIIDPAKVTKQALLNASSIAGLMLTTEALVSEIKEEKEAAPAGAPGMGGMGGMY
jgi:chaperonin GroEL